jgi:hypothetical protein
MSAETKHNYEKFSNELPTAIAKNVSALRGKEHLVQSYGRVAAMNAVKLDLFVPNKSADSVSFFAEAHNDALLSHVNASFGSWRPALQALRSFVENTLSAIYFMDHPIELQKWKERRFWISPKDLRDYISDHPAISVYTLREEFRQSLTDEYATLSKAVHGSSPLFRMSTVDGATNFGNASVSDLGKWSTRERAALISAQQSLSESLHQYLDGAKLPALRDALFTACPRQHELPFGRAIQVNLGGS